MINSFDSLPDSAYIRVAQLVRDPKRPDRQPLLDISLATFWRMVAADQFVTPVKLSARVTAFRVGDIRKWLEARKERA
jgi:prophage regulatory protein